MSKKQYPVGKQFDVPVEVPDGEGDVKPGWALGTVVNHFENRIGHEYGVVVEANGQYINIPYSLLYEDGSGLGG